MERDIGSAEQSRVPGEDRPGLLGARVSRRTVLRALMVSAFAGGSSSLIAACSGGQTSPSSAVAAKPASQAPGASPAAAGTQVTQVKEGGTLRYGLSSDPPSLDPHVDTGYASQLVKGTIYSLLVRPDPKMQIVPDLAESWETPDDKTYVFHLRKNVKWHDGSEFTSADVKATIERIQDPKTGAYARGDLLVIDKIDTPDALTVKFTLKNPDAPFLAVLAGSNSLIASKALLDKGADLKNQIVGTGPFKMGDYQPGVHEKLVRNENYYIPGRVHLDGITFTPYPDDTSRVTALRTGAVDIIDYVPWKDMSTIEADKKLALYSDKEGAMMFLVMRVDKPPLNNPKVRQAISYAIDRKAVLDTVFFGRGRVLGGLPTPQWMFTYSPDRQDVYTLNPEKSKQLLAEAGYPNGFKIELLSTSTYAMHKDTAEIVQAGLKNVGIDVSLDLTDWATTVARRAKGDFQLHVNGAGVELADPAYLNQYFSSTGPYFSWTGFSDKQVDDLLARGQATSNVDQRKQIYRDLEQRLLDLSTISWICTREQAEATQAYVKNYVHMPGANRSQQKVVEVWLDK